MSRYIDADALLKELHKAKEENEKARMVLIDYDFETLIKDAPTVDVEPRHGKWIENDTVTYRLYELNNGESYCQEIIYPFFCSECRGGSEYKSRYCMDCGAKMDKE